MNLLVLRIKMRGWVYGSVGKGGKGRRISEFEASLVYKVIIYSFLLTFVAYY